MAETPTNKWDELRKPFPKESIGLLPKPYKRDSPKGKCQECGGYHGLPAVHLDYVGHAAVTDRLNSVMGPDNWDWEPFATDANGLPQLDRSGGLWIRLTIDGATRIGYGDGSTSMKELIGDALRNAAMRFGVALDLWSKEELESAIDAPELKNDKPSKAKPEFPALEQEYAQRSTEQVQQVVNQPAEEMETLLDELIDLMTDKFSPNQIRAATAKLHTTEDVRAAITKMKEVK